VAVKYPDNIVSFTNKVDVTDAVVANDVNVVYAEVIAIAAELGLKPSQRTNSTWNTTWTNSGNTKWLDVKSRLDNVEDGAHRANYYLVSNAGGTTITPSSASTVGLKVTATTSQTANLFEARANGATDPTTLVDKDGKFITLVIDGGSSLA
jgi:hypothetical protein